MQERRAQMEAAFTERFGGRPTHLACAPGRANLIGEHTDYNDGYVLPIAIDRDMWVAFRPRSDTLVRLYSLEFDDASEFDLEGIERAIEGEWSNYVRGVAAQLTGRTPLASGFDAALHGTVPIGSGLSSSAAIEVAALVALAHANGVELSTREVAQLAQAAENAFVGVPSGIMDQFISAAGQADHALLLDCRSLETEQIPLPGDVRLVVSDSGVRRNLGQVEYAKRVEATRSAADAIGVPALRDVTPEMLEAAVLPYEIARRARHVVEENVRVLAAVDAIRRGDMVELGQLINASHQSLRDLYEVSVPELDLLVEIARGVEGCYGARLTGAGFGGSTIALTTVEAAPAIAAAIEAQYPPRSGYPVAVYICKAEAGSSVTPW
ncbi:MAG TPA: galactokinase [Ardenticatenaceae bacterium]|nr:galactokinase [Ardenticatenaceae bacterium]